MANFEVSLKVRTPHSFKDGSMPSVTVDVGRHKCEDVLSKLRATKNDAKHDKDKEITDLFVLPRANASRNDGSELDEPSTSAAVELHE